MAELAVRAYVGNFKGPKGDKGDKGDKGQQGSNGATGAPGATGAKGETGTRGSLWYNGVGITGTSTTSTVFAKSGVTAALVGDYYINTGTGGDRGRVYRCTVAGAASVAKWVYAGTIVGPQGQQGIQGPIGPAGPNSADLINVVDTHGAAVSPGATTKVQTLINAIADKVANKLLLRSDVVSQIVNDAEKAASMAALYSVKQQVTQLNSDLDGKTSNVAITGDYIDTYALKAHIVAGSAMISGNLKLKKTVPTGANTVVGRIPTTDVPLTTVYFSLLTPNGEAYLASFDGGGNLTIYNYTGAAVPVAVQLYVIGLTWVFK